MNKFMNWLSESFAPAAKKLFAKPWIAAVSASMQKIIPYILTGSVIFFYGVFRSFIPSLPDLGAISNYSFGIINLIVAFVVGNQCMEKLGHPEYLINAGLTSVGVLLMVAMPFGESADSLSAFMGNLGPSGMIVGILVGVFVSVVFHLWGKMNFLKDSSVPDFVVSWINTILPNLIVFGISMVLTQVLKINVYDLIIGIFMPVVKIGQTLPGFIIISLLHAFFYTLGVSTWFWGAITNPIFMIAIEENIANAAAGLPATNIVTSEAFFTLAFITMGGVCATLGLNILMCFSKSKQVKMLGHVFLAPSIFNINEPIMFGAPVVFNPTLMLPAWINGIIGPVYVWILMSTGLLKVPSTMIQVGQIPAPFCSVMVTQDIRAILWWIILLAIYTAVWFPFFKEYEKEKLAEEAE